MAVKKRWRQRYPTVSLKLLAGSSKCPGTTVWVPIPNGSGLALGVEFRGKYGEQNIAKSYATMKQSVMPVRCARFWQAAT